MASALRLKCHDHTVAAYDEKVAAVDWMGPWTLPIDWRLTGLILVSGNQSLAEDALRDAKMPRSSTPLLPSCTQTPQLIAQSGMHAPITPQIDSDIASGSSGVLDAFLRYSPTGLGPNPNSVDDSLEQVSRECKRTARCRIGTGPEECLLAGNLSPHQRLACSQFHVPLSSQVEIVLACPAVRLEPAPTQLQIGGT